MKRISMAACAVIISGAAQARGSDVCHFVSEYDLRIQPDRLVFHRDGGEVRMQGGRLVVDGREVRLDDADSGRLRRYESHVRALVPQVRAIALDGVKVASRAVGEALAPFDGAGATQAMRRVNELADDIAARIATSNDTAEWDENELEATIERVAAEIVPMIAGDVAASAVDAAMSGDLQAADDLRRRVQDLPAVLERTVERRIAPLEARARALCPRIAALDALEREITTPLPGNRRLDLLEAAPR